MPTPLASSTAHTGPLRPVERRTTAERVERTLRDAILNGRWSTGEKLPPERELSTQLGVTRVTLRSALARLAAAGLLSTVQGDGHRVRDLRTTAGLERLPAMVEAFAGEPARVEVLVGDLLALRRVVMAEACARASLAPAEARAQLVPLVEAMAAAQDRAAFVACDLAFSRAVLGLADNVAFELTFNTVASLAEAHPAVVDALWHDPSMQLRGARSLLTLLASGEPELVRTTVRAALEALDTLCLERVADALRRAARPPASPRAHAQTRTPRSR